MMLYLASRATAAADAVGPGAVRGAWEGGMGLGRGWDICVYIA